MLCECWGGKNHFFAPVHNWIYECIRDWHPLLDLEVGSSLKYEYSVTHGAAKAAWYSLCVRRSLGELNVRILGGKVRWMVGCVCGRMFSWCEKEKAWSWGRVMEL